ncbi:hypothetical protein LTR54_018421, partial [Friedmanniomyces endolithicus]
MHLRLRQPLPRRTCRPRATAKNDQDAQVAGDKNQTLPGEEEGLDPEVAKQYQRIKDDEDELLLDAIADFTELAGAA